MRRNLLAAWAAIAIAIAIVPASAHADQGGSFGSWISDLFGWHVPLEGRVSDMVEARQDSVQDNGLERERLLMSRSAAGTAGFSAASTSPSAMPAGLFREKRASIVLQLEEAVNGLKGTAVQLSGFISDAEGDGSDMTAAESALGQADGDVDAASAEVGTLAGYEPPAAADGTVDVSAAQGELDGAVSAIGTARDSLQSVIDIASASADRDFQ
jgi:hypothetical protein